MKKEQDYAKDIADIRSMMERSSKFLSLSGWAGVMAGIYALAGAYIAYRYFQFSPQWEAQYDQLSRIVPLAAIVLVLSIGTAVVLSKANASRKGEKVWNNTSKRLLTNMSVPLLAGGILVLIMISRGSSAWMAPLTLIFYGLALYNAGNFTYREMKALGIIQVVLGLIAGYYVEYGLLLWALGFGVMHIAYGIYLHYRYER